MFNTICNTLPTRGLDGLFLGCSSFNSFMIAGTIILVWYVLRLAKGLVKQSSKVC